MITVYGSIRMVSLVERYIKDIDCGIKEVLTVLQMCLLEKYFYW